MTLGGTLAALVEDAFSALQVPGGSTASSVLQRMLRRREEAARDMLLKELRRGNKTICDVDEGEVAEIVFRYMRAAQEGTARVNLRLMAEVIAGQAAAGNLVADEFLYYADILASLRYEEVVVLATLYRTTQEAIAKHTGDNILATQAMTAASLELSQTLGFKDLDFAATAGAIMRTGLIASAPGQGGGFNIYYPTSLMDKLYALAPFEKALEEERERRQQCR